MKEKKQTKKRENLEDNKKEIINTSDNEIDKDTNQSNDDEFYKDADQSNENEIKEDNKETNKNSDDEDIKTTNDKISSDENDSPDNKNLKKNNYTKYFLYLLGFVFVVFAIIFLIPKFYHPTVETVAEDHYRYNYFDFYKIENVWTTQTQEGDNLYLINLRHGPLELEKIKVTGNIQKFRDNYPFYYVTFDPREENHDGYVTMASAEISPNLVVHLNKGVEAAFIVNDTTYSSLNISIITCDSTQNGVIFINNINTTPTVEIKDNCAIISGTGEGLVSAADRFMYGMYKIMK